MSHSAQRVADLSPAERRALLATLLRKKASEGPPVYPLSYNQQGIWFLHQLAPESMVYNVNFAARICSDVDIPALRRAFQTLIDRHPSLRTTFSAHSGKPVQQIHKQLKAHVEHTDASAWRSDELKTRLIEDAYRPFDLERGPLLRASLFSCSAHEYILLLVVHHIVIDFWSLAVLLRELGVLYPAERAGVPASLPPLDVQYTDYVRWQAEMLASPEGERLWAYWQKQLGGQLPVLDLPTDRPRPSVQTYRGASHDFSLDDDLSAQVKALAKAQGATLYMVLLAAFQVMLHHHTGQEDLLVASPMVGRSRAEFEGIVGLFTNPVFLRANLSGNPTFQAHLGQVRQTVLGALEHQDYPTLRLVAQLRPSRDLSRSPISQVMFVLDKPQGLAEQGAPTFVLGETGLRMNPGGLVLESLPLERRAATLDLVLLAIETPRSLSISLRYNTALFDAATITRLARHFETLLRHVVSQPDVTLTALKDRLAESDGSTLSEAERQQLLIEFNDTESGYPRDRCVHQPFEQQVARTPDNVAVVFEAQQLTYAQLNARANQVAHYLKTLGVGPEVPVAICMERSLETVVGLLAILKAGGAYVPLDPTYPMERLAFLLEDARAPVLLTQRHLAERMPAPGMHRVCLDSDWDAIAPMSEQNPVITATTKNAAYVIYTSGSTGQPKGVTVEHGGLTNAVHWITVTLALSAEDRCLLKTPITFDAAGRELFPTLLTGGRLVIAKPDGHRDCRYLAQMICENRISILHCVPSLLRLLIAEPALDDAVTLRAVMCGGEALASPIVMKFQQRCRAKLFNVYGPTEATIDSTCWLCPAGSDRSAIPIGRPIPNVRTYVVDDALRPLPIGAAGELLIGGVGVARGYLNRPALTAEKFVPDPFSAAPGARLYKTGDLARYLPDGNIEFLGRADHQVKIRGFRIELGEIEAVLGQHPAVREAVVAARDDTPGETRLVAYVVAEPPLAAHDLRSFLKEKLPEHMVPAVFVPLDALLLTPTGKVDRRALPAPDRTRPEFEPAFVAPRTPTEELTAEIWTELLGVEPVGIHDNFFDLGGHSLLATQVVSRVRDTFQVEIPLRRLFEEPTVASLAESIEVARRAGQNLQAPNIQPVPRDGDLPLSFAQQRLWFIDQLAPGNPAYNFPAAVHLRGPLNLAALQHSLNEIVKRHELLRTTFAIVDGRPVQVIAPTLTIALPVMNLRELPEAEREVEVQRLVTEEANLPFSLAAGPLVRATALQLGETEYVGLLTMHHIVADGWSVGILIRELAVVYEALSGARSSPLPELPIQYADFAHWQRQWLQGDVLDTQLSYWKQQLRGAPPLLDLLPDHPRPVVQTFRGAHESLLLPEGVGAGLKALSREAGATLFMTVLAAFKVLLQRYTGQDDIVIGTPIANRNRREIEGLIGFFVNTIVLRTDLGGDPSFRELLGRVREVCLGAYAHQDLPFEKLVEEVHVERDLSRNPLFQVMFVLQNGSPRAVELPGLTLSPVEGSSETAHFDLTLQIVDDEQGLTATFVYNADLFEAATIAHMLRTFQTLLSAVVADPALRLSDLPLLTKAEQQQLVVEWNDSKTDSPQDLGIHQLFEAEVARTPDAIAVVCAGEELTYAELNRRTNQLAHHLRTLGVGPEVAVGICVEPSSEMIIGLLGILKAGGVYVPLDPTYPQERLAFMLDDARVPVLLTQARLASGLPEHRARVVCLDSGWEAIARESAENPASATMPQGLAYVIYTSGSTGRPKGVLVSHGSIAEHCRAVQKYYEIVPNDRVLQLASLSFDLSLEQILPTLIAGAGLVMMGADIWPPAEFHKRASQFGLTVLNLPTGYWQELAREWADVPELVQNIQARLFVVGGDSMSPAALDLWQRTPVSSIRLLNAYGPTETTITATAFEIGPRLCETTPLLRVPIGRPLANRAIYILDQHDNPVPIGVPGELHVGGLGIAQGYLNRPELTAAKFVPDPFSSAPGARLYKTGDLARYLPDGNIEFLGRADDQVKVRGFRIEPGEIEAVLGQHPAVHEAVVAARDDALGEKRLVAYVVAAPQSPPTAQDLRSFLKQKLPEHMVPAVFVRLDALPLTPTGKVDRRALSAPDGTRPELEKTFVAPRDVLEIQLTHLWEEVLSVRPIGVTDNFFELGGHSMAAVRLFALIENQLGTRLPLAAVFQGATIEHLAGLLRHDAIPASHPCLVPIQPGFAKPPLFLVHPAGGHVFPYIHLADALGRDQPCYGLQGRGLEAGQDPQARIEDMAVYYLEAVQSVQSHGPYLLGGWSMGGLVAFEMAQQLLAQGQRVALLALLDARLPTPDEKFAEEDLEATLLGDVVRYFGLSLGPWEALSRLPKHELLTRVLEQAQHAGLVPPDIQAFQAQRFLELCKADFRATRNYALRCYAGRVTLFKASEELGGTPSDPMFGWSRWASGGVDLHVVPGNHANMVYKPHVEVLAEKLRACVEQATSGDAWFADEVGSPARLMRDAR
jgi:amino acid adenylation domain-containing protein